MAKRTHTESPIIANRNISADGRETSANLTELEGVILGIVWSRQPCSSYVVLSRFQRSPTWGWSSSTGAIYPAIRRLKARELLDQRSDSTGKRKSQLLVLSAEGESALQRWIVDLTDEMGSAGVDPIRARVNYIAALAPEERTRFLDRAEAVTRSRLTMAHESRGDPLARDNWTLEATTSALAFQLEARLRWLKHLRKLVAEHGAGDA